MRVFGGQQSKEYNLHHANSLQSSWGSGLNRDPTITVPEAVDSDKGSFCWNLGKMLIVLTSVFLLLCIQASAFQKTQREEMKKLEKTYEAKLTELQTSMNQKVHVMQNSVEYLQVRFASYDKQEKDLTSIKNDLKYVWETVVKQELLVFVKNGGMMNPIQGFEAVEASLRKHAMEKFNVLVAEALGIPVEALQMFTAGLPSIEQMASTFPAIEQWTSTLPPV